MISQSLFHSFEMRVASGRFSGVSVLGDVWSLRMVFLQLWDIDVQWGRRFRWSERPQKPPTRRANVHTNRPCRRIVCIVKV